MNFIRRDGDSSSVPSTSTVAAARTSGSLSATSGGDKDQDKSSPSTSESGSQDSEIRSQADSLSALGPSTTSIGLICVSGESEFDVIRVWGENVIQVGPCLLFQTLTPEPNTLQRLEREGSLEAISNAVRSGDSAYSVSALGIPGLRHFLYKSRSHVQVTGPEFEEPYEDVQERRRY